MNNTIDSFMENQTIQRKHQGLHVLTPEDNFSFDCHSGLDCFTRCCRNINIFLTPYDVLRLKNGLNISSHEFLNKYTITLMGRNGLPVIALKMEDDDKKSCPFVTSNGCRVYEHRPWSCRIYPLQPESTKTTEKAGKEYYSVMDIPFCRGFHERSVSTVEEWIENQGIPVYKEMEKLFKKITMNDFLSTKKIQNKTIQEMYFMACYDLDRFRRFVFESSFLNQFEIDKSEKENIKFDDVSLCQFAMKWLEFGLIGQHALKVKPEIVATQKDKLGIK